jgi:hypothetical protein
MVMRVATFFPFQTTYYLNGHNFIEQELNRAQVGFRKNDNAFLAIDDVAALALFQYCGHSGCFGGDGGPMAFSFERLGSTTGGFRL